MLLRWSMVIDQQCKTSDFKKKTGPVCEPKIQLNIILLWVESRNGNPAHLLTSRSCPLGLGDSFAINHQNTPLQLPLAFPPSQWPSSYASSPCPSKSSLSLLWTQKYTIWPKVFTLLPSHTHVFEWNPILNPQGLLWCQPTICRTAPLGTFHKV